MNPRQAPVLGSSPAPSAGEIARTFLKLGCISFGGPVAHLGYLREEIVVRRRWLDDATYSDLVALCQFLPGPASSQVVFALGMHRGGLLGAIIASICFTLPSAVLMILCAYGVTFLGHLRSAGWVHGLKLAAVAVVAQAVWGMGKKLCVDRARVSLALGAAAVLLLIPNPWVQIGVIAAGALLGWTIYRREILPQDSLSTQVPQGHVAAAAVFGLWLVLLLLLPVVSAASGSRTIAILDSFYRSGSLVFGGGHVILPLLRAELIPPGWVGEDTFLAGYGLAQAVPGPLFTFAGYLGTVIHGGAHAWVGGVGCLAAILLPAWLLVGSALPFWHTLRSKAWAHAALRGANASVVGILLAALYDPVWKEGVSRVSDVVLVGVAFVSLEIWRLPPWLIVLAAAGIGVAIR